ncbi:metallophosphoesterase [Methanobrevibacter sp.]
MTKIGIISDTHVGKNDDSILGKLSDNFDDVDLIFHTGDITQQDVLDELSVIAPVIAVKGNADSFILNETEIISINNFKIILNHGIGLSDDFDKIFEFGEKYSADIVVTGHTHKPHLNFKENMCFINPGSFNRPIDSDASIAILEITKENKNVNDIQVNFIKL